MRKNMTEKALVLLSGGADSIANAILLEKMGLQIHGLWFDYGQPNREAELYIIERLRDRWPIDIEKVNGLKVAPHWNDNSDAYVPLRNTLFMVLGMKKIIQLGEDVTVLSIGCSLQYDEGVFFDNSQQHHEMLQEIWSLSFKRKLQILSPIVNMKKSEVIKIVEDNKLPFVSCWNARLDYDLDEDMYGRCERGPIKGILVCGKCLQCREVEKARQGEK
jgi:7-cyano-7-deazaguanine synthase in queuosine biosynthesis